MRLIRSIALVFTAILFFQCQRELSFVGTPDPQIVLPEPITSSVQGNVMDENGQPEAGVMIRVGSKTATTDQRGYFRIMDAALDKHASLVTAEKAGYFKAIRTFSATSGVNHVEIKLIKRTLAGTVNGATGGDASLSNGAKVSLPANGVVVDATGAVYTGDIQVYAAYIDPTAADIYEVVPGSFMANDRNGGRVLMSSYGMMAVELESNTGEKLQIKSGSVAKLTMPIPSAGQPSAPATIPLWYVDEQTGLWKEEGSAVKQGNIYVGDVKHFTYWNCDIPLPTVNFSATLETPAGDPLVHAHVMIKPTTGTFFGSAHGYTDTLGQVSGPVPANMPLVLQVVDPCGNVVYSQNIGPFTQNTNLGTITVNLPSSPSIITVKGKLLTCANTAVIDGFALLVIGNKVRYAAVDANGNFSATFIECGTPNSVEVLGVDETTNQQGSVQSFPVTGAITNVGDISACGTSAAQFINYTVDGINYSIPESDSLVAWTQPIGGTTTGPFSTMVNGANLSNSNNIGFSFNHPTQTNGTYQVVNFWTQNFPQPTVIQPFNVVITNFPTSIGQFYEGSFSGSFQQGTATHTVSGTFRIRRNF